MFLKMVTSFIRNACFQPSVTSIFYAAKTISLLLKSLFFHSGDIKFLQTPASKVLV